MCLWSAWVIKQSDYKTFVRINKFGPVQIIYNEKIVMDGAKP